LTGTRETRDRRYPRLELPRELSLTAREIDVAVRIAAGESSKEIARRLNVSIRTVQFHRQSLRDKLDIVGGGLSLRHALLKYEIPHS
jgi:DNA-binding CsgD family transcriptional regulator